MGTDRYDPEREGAETKFSDKISYTDYLGLDEVLNAQKAAHPDA